MQTFDAIAGRASTREYQDKPVARGLLEKIVDAGRRAPTARAVEPWEFVVIENKDTLHKLGELVSPNGAFVKGAACCIVIFCRDTKYYLEDGCAATENILLAVEDLGLGACWIAGDKKPYAADVGGLLGAAQELKLISLISLGWPKKKANQAKSRSLDDVIHWERF